MEYNYTYKLTFALMKKDIPADFSFRQGKYRDVLDDKIVLSNEKGKLVANPKHMQIIEEETTDRSLTILLKTEKRLEKPTQGCKTLSKELAMTELYQSLLTEKGKLFAGKDWVEVDIPQKKPLEDSELMKLLTKMMLRNQQRDRDMLERIKQLLEEAYGPSLRRDSE